MLEQRLSEQERAAKFQVETWQAEIKKLEETLKQSSKINNKWEEDYKALFDKEKIKSEEL